MPPPRFLNFVIPLTITNKRDIPLTIRVKNVWFCDQPPEFRKDGWKLLGSSLHPLGVRVEDAAGQIADPAVIPARGWRTFAWSARRLHPLFSTTRSSPGGMYLSTGSQNPSCGPSFSSLKNTVGAAATSPISGPCSQCRRTTLACEMHSSQRCMSTVCAKPAPEASEQPGMDRRKPRAAWGTMVGPSRFELPTSPLSARRAPLKPAPSLHFSAPVRTLLLR